MNSNKFEWTPKRVQEFTAIYAGNFTGNKRFSRSDFIGLRYEAKVKKYESMISELEPNTREREVSKPRQHRFGSESPLYRVPEASLSQIRTWAVEDIMSRIVLPNMGWRANSNESIEARGEIGEAIEVLLNDVDRYYK
tara:strand:+ start:1413 stop:1826 length:414 start_codon:yes stop_codon:yes gene_type:complete